MAARRNRRREAGERVLSRMVRRPTMKTVRRAPVVRVSAKIQAEYRRRLQASNQQYKKQVDKAVKKLLAEINALDRDKPGAFQKQAARMQKRIDALDRNLTAANKRSIAAVDRFVKQSEQENLARIKRSLSKTHGPAITEALLNEKQQQVRKRTDKLRAGYVESITSANRNYSDRVQRALYEKLANPNIDARKKIRRARGIVSRRIKNTVQNHAHELNAALNNTRQRALGVTKYIWQTMEDERVRHQHDEQNRVVFSWARRPNLTGHPGEDHGCRCIAIPLLEDIPVGTRLR